MKNHHGGEVEGRVPRRKQGGLANRTGTLGVLILAWSIGAGGSQGNYPPRLSGLSVETSSFQVKLLGETLGGYVVEGSTNLLHWHPLLTNTSRHAVREISIPRAGSSRMFVRARTEMPDRFRFALAAEESLHLNGHELYVDGYDSRDDAASTYGQYDPAKRLDGAEAALGLGIADALDGGRLELYGSLSVSSRGGLDLPPHSSVGSHAWHATGNQGFEPGHGYEDLALKFPEWRVPYPAGAGFYPFAGVYNAMVYHYVLLGGDYSMAYLHLQSTARMIVTAPSRLQVTGDLSMQGSASITIVHGASLELYLGGTNAFFGGAGIQNLAGPENLLIVGAIATTNLVFTMSNLSARVYAPRAHVVLDAGEGEQGVLMGSFLGRSITLEDSWRLHYDRSLRPVGWDDGDRTQSGVELSACVPVMTASQQP